MLTNPSWNKGTTAGRSHFDSAFKVADLSLISGLAFGSLCQRLDHVHDFAPQKSKSGWFYTLKVPHAPTTWQRAYKQLRPPQSLQSVVLGVGMTEATFGYCSLTTFARGLWLTDFLVLDDHAILCFADHSSEKVDIRERCWLFNRWTLPLLDSTGIVDSKKLLKTRLSPCPLERQLFGLHSFSK